ncbi:MAG: glycosyltransferase family 39 protein [Bryobacterales bacterium]|nr:glycosyltransferase family 39 protein [Bryobacterales bacterium]
MARNKGLAATAAALVLIFAYWFYLSSEGLHAYFTGDDGMNLQALHHYWQKPYWQAVLDAFAIATPAYRPVGGLFYRTLYPLFGFDPLPFRVACYIILAWNLLLAYFLLRRLSGSRRAALFALVLFSFHASMIDLYYNTGTVYDLLCFTFYISALAVYVRARRAGAFRWRTAFAVLALYGGALGSKEMAVTFPAALLLYEGLWHFRESRWIRSRAAGVITASSLMTGVFLYVKIALPNAMSGNTLYRPSLSPVAILNAFCHYADLLLYVEGKLFTPVSLLLTVCVLLVFAWSRRSRAMVFGLFFFFVSLIPVSVIPPRSGFVMYLPALGFALYVGVVVKDLCTAVSRIVPVEPVRAAVPVTAFFILIVTLLPIHVERREHYARGLRHWHRVARDFMAELTSLYPTLPAGARLMLLDDPFDRDDWAPLFFARTLYNDPGLLVERQKRLAGPATTDELILYNHVLDYRDGYLAERPLPNRISGPAVPLVFVPEKVRPGESYVVHAPALAGKTVDVAVRLQSGSVTQAAIVRNWCTLDASGEAKLVTPADHISATVEIVGIRQHNGPWRQAKGGLAVVR